MSFGSSSAMRFELDATHGKPAIFWDQGKKPQKTRKFGYKSKELRHPVRNPQQEDSNREVVVFHHDNRKVPHQPLEERTEQPEQKSQKPTRPAKDFIRKNRKQAGGKKQEEVEGGTKKDHPMANTVTLTQDQLNAILASVGKMASGKENALRISIDNDSNEIEIANAAVEEVKEGVKDSKEDDTETEENIFSLLKEPKSNDRQVVRDTQGKEAAKQKGGRRHTVRLREDDVSVSVSSVKDKDKKRKDEKKSNKSASDETSVKVDKLDLSDTKHGEEKSRGEEAKHGESNLLYYESPRVAPTHLTVAEKKRLQWARERADLNQNYDPWGRPGAGAPLRDNTGQVLADYNNRKDELRKSLDTETDIQGNKTSEANVRETRQEKGGHHHREDSSPHSKAAVVGFVIDEEKAHNSKDEEKKKWLEELEKQREDQRQKKHKSKQRDQSGPDDTWADRFSTHKHAPLPSQDKLATDKRSSQLESTSSPNIANPQHAAIRSSFVSGNVAPDDKRFSQTKNEEKRKWLEDLERQIEEKRLGKMRDKDRESVSDAPDTWADRFTQNQNTNQSAVERLPDPEPTPQPESSGRVSSAPQQLSARDIDDLDNTHVRGQHVVIDPITRQEMEFKKRRYLEHQDALKRQIEEKDRLKREERQRKMMEEMEEEEKLRKERDSLQNQFSTDQQKIRQKEEARQRRIDELKQAMDEAQGKAQQEKLIRRMEHLRQGGHDVSHLQAHLDAMSPRVHQVEPAHVPGLNLRQSQESYSTGPHLPEISSRTVDIPNPMIGTHAPYTENRVLTPKGDLNGADAEPRREVSEIDIEYKDTRTGNKVRPTKKVRVKSAEQEVKVELRRERKNERVERLRPGEKTKWNYQNPKFKRSVKQSEKDPFFERKRQQSEERRARREKELLAIVELNKPIIPDERGYRSRDPSPGKDGHTPRSHKGRSLSPDRQGHARRRGDNSLSPNRSTERERGRRRSPVRHRSPSPPVPTLRTNEALGHSPPVPALKHRREGGKGERAQVLKVNDSDGYSNTYDNDQYNYTNFHPASGQRRNKGHYEERNPIEAPVDSGDFVPFTRTTEILDPAKAVEPIQLSRENTQVKKGRKAYKENHNPGSFGSRLENVRDRQDNRNDPIMNPGLVKGHPTARQDMILQQLSTLKQSLMQRQRELETCMSPSDYDQ